MKKIIEELLNKDNSVLKSEIDTNYTKLNNHHLQDPALSWKAKGLLTYALSRPASWHFSISHLTKSVCSDGETSTRSGITELQKNRYWQKYPVYKNGKILHYIDKVSDVPFDEKEMVKNIKIYEEKDKTITLVTYQDDREIEQIDLLSGNLKTGSLKPADVETGNEGLLITDYTNNLSFTNHSLNQEQEEKVSERVSEDKNNDLKNNKYNEIDVEDITAKLDIDDYPKEELKIIKQSLYNLINSDSEKIGNVCYNNAMIKRIIDNATYNSVSTALAQFGQAEKEKRIHNRQAYFDKVLFKAMVEEPIHNTYLGGYC